jgi:hypothetical protein
MQQIEFIPLEKLKLDNKNPRLPSNFNNKSENDIIEWMLEDESIIELMYNARYGFWPFGGFL